MTHFFWYAKREKNMTLSFLNMANKWFDFLSCIVKDPFKFKLKVIMTVFITFL